MCCGGDYPGGDCLSSVTQKGVFQAGSAAQKGPSKAGVFPPTPHGPCLSFAPECPALASRSQNRSWLPMGAFCGSHRMDRSKAPRGSTLGGWPGPRLLQLWVETSEAWEKARSLRGQKVPALGPPPHSCSSLSAPSEQTAGLQVFPSLPACPALQLKGMAGEVLSEPEQQLTPGPSGLGGSCLPDFWSWVSPPQSLPGSWCFLV